jgi:hypothetical protein
MYDSGFEWDCEPNFVITRRIPVKIFVEATLKSKSYLFS